MIGKNDILDRVCIKSLQDKIVTAEEAAAIIKPGMNIGTSGFTPSGYPKAVPLALAERMNCTQQYVSKILKGKENLSLDTISRLEDALGISLVYPEVCAFQPSQIAEEMFV